MNSRWQSVHVFYHDFQKLDGLVRGLVEPLFSDRLKDIPFFFVRYWEGGPHLRIRFLADHEDVRTVVDACEAYVYAAPCSKTLTAANFYLQVMKLRTDEWMQYSWYANNTVCEIRYVAETDRYGGHEGLLISEQLFYHSTQLAIQSIRQAQSLNDKIVAGIAFAYFLISQIESLNMRRIIEFLDNQITGWQVMLNSQVQALKQRVTDQLANHTDSLTAAIKTLLDDLRQSQKTALLLLDQLCQTESLTVPYRQIVATHIHMHFNRLGVSPPYELFSLLLLREMLSDGRLGDMS